MSLTVFEIRDGHSLPPRLAQLVRDIGRRLLQSGR